MQEEDFNVQKVNQGAIIKMKLSCKKSQNKSCFVLARIQRMEQMNGPVMLVIGQLKSGILQHRCYMLPFV